MADISQGTAPVHAGSKVRVTKRSTKIDMSRYAIVEFTEEDRERISRQ